MRVIDFQAHFMPKEYMEMLGKRKEPPYIEKMGDKYDFQYGVGSGYTITKNFYDLNEKLAAMDLAGIDLQVLSMNIPGAEILDVKSSVDIARSINDSYAQIVASHPSRFLAFTTLPWRDTDASLAELERATVKLGFKGITLFSNVMGIPVDDARFWPIYELAEALDQPILIHPTRPIIADAVNNYGLETMVGYIFDTTLAALRLILSGVLKKYPNLKIILPHAGSTLPYLRGRIDFQSTLNKESRKNIKEAPSYYIKKLYMDSVCLSAGALKMAYDLVGPDQILFATDHPFVGMRESLELIMGMDIPEINRQKILYDNASHLLKMS